MGANATIVKIYASLSWDVLHIVVRLAAQIPGAAEGSGSLRSRIICIQGKHSRSCDAPYYAMRMLHYQADSAQINLSGRG